MDQLISGLSLMLVGMATVFCFLTLLVICINISSRVINRFWPEGLTPAELSTHSSTQQSSSNINDDTIAAITAAIHQYRTKDKRNKHQ